MGLGEILCYISAHNKNRQDTWVHDWEQTRYLAFTAYRNNGYIKASSMPKKPSDLFPLDTDQKEKPFNLKAALKRRAKVLKAWGPILNSLKN